MRLFDDLPFSVQSYINKRFAQHGMSGREAYNSTDVFPDELKELPPDDIVNLLEHKHISHIMPQSKYPEFADKIENIVLEDIAPNIDRSDAIMSDTEKETAFKDLLEDIEDGDINEDGITDLESVLNQVDNSELIEDIIGASLFGAMVFTGVQAVNGVRNDEVALREIPNFFIYKTGGRTIKLAVVGTLLATGSPIIVGGTTAYILYRSKNLFKSVFRNVYRAVTSQRTKDFLTGTGSVIVTTGKLSGGVLKKSASVAYNVATHDRTKAVGKSTAKGLYKAGESTLKAGFNVAKLTSKGLVWIGKKSKSILNKK